MKDVPSDPRDIENYPMLKLGTNAWTTTCLGMGDGHKPIGHLFWDGKTCLGERILNDRVY